MEYNSFDAHLPLLSLPSGKTNALQDYRDWEISHGPLKLGPWEIFHLSDCCSAPSDQLTILEDKMEAFYLSS